MKYLIIILLFISIVACDSDDNDCTGIDCLPPITQTGAGTFGCLINGEPFVDTSGRFNCFYQFVDGQYYFSISGNDDDLTPRVIRLSTNELEVSSQHNYILSENAANQAHAAVIFYSTGDVNNSNTTDQIYKGEMNIDTLNFESNIVSGTFFFQIKDVLTGEVYNITDGRFDSQFTR